MNKPCLNCTRVKNPEECGNAACRPWRRWFLDSWDRLRRGPRLAKEAPPEFEGVGIGGRRYALPHRVYGYLDKDPCRGCLCPGDLCRIPCRIKRDWTRNRQLVQ